MKNGRRVDITMPATPRLRAAVILPVRSEMAPSATTTWNSPLAAS
ncbi:Uncharacterised protein [Mycobacterium tuberculosis]|nr:Uncharacterised protein [Mycobacterium tuberculosis]